MHSIFFNEDGEIQINTQKKSIQVYCDDSSHYPAGVVCKVI